MSPAIFTLGYEKRTLEEFVRLLRRARVNIVIDVRETAWSHKPGFSKASFAQALDRAGIEYLHASFAGNPKWLRSTAASHAECLSDYRWYLREYSEVAEAFMALISDLAAEGKRACLVCFERHHDDCHRGILAELVEDRAGAQVTHLAPTGCARLVAS